MGLTIGGKSIRDHNEALGHNDAYTLHPIHYAARLHKEIATIHPFSDWNGRTSRLVMNLALLQVGYPIAIIAPVLRNDYISAIRLANKGTVWNLFIILYRI
jgi:Fic family protein